MKATNDVATDFRAHMNGGNFERPQWLDARAGEAMDVFESAGFPGRRVEEWKHTSVEPVARTGFVPANGEVKFWSPERFESVKLPDLGGPRLVFINGGFAPHLSILEPLPDGVHIGSIADLTRRFPDMLEHDLGRYAAVDGSPFTALNTALWNDGAVVLLSTGVVVDDPVHLVHLTSSPVQHVASHPRTIVVCGSGSRLDVVESYIGGGHEDCYLANAVTEIVLKKDAVMNHCRAQQESGRAFHVGRLAVRQERGSCLATTSLALGSALARFDLGIELAGEGAVSTLNGLYITDGDRHADQHTDVDHAVPNCTSSELYKGILSGRSNAVFDGRIHVRQDAQKTVAMQSNRNLLLSRDATVHTRPRLAILADDVRCTHGATIGRLDDDALFYLRARGIDSSEARRMLVHAFAGEILDGIGIPAMRDAMSETISGRLAGVGS